MKRVNICGIPEEELKDGVCDACNSHCQITEEYLVEKRVYDYAKKYYRKSLTVSKYPMFRQDEFVEQIQSSGKLEKAPKYIQNFVKQYKESHSQQQTN